MLNQTNILLVLRRDEMVSTSWYQPLVFSWLIPGFYWRKNQTEKTRPMTGIHIRVTKFYLFIQKLNSLKSNKLSIFNKILTIKKKFQQKICKKSKQPKKPKKPGINPKNRKNQNTMVVSQKPWYLSSLSHVLFVS